MSAVVADLVTATLANAGISRVFCVPGAHIDELCRSVSSRSDMELVVCRTEQGSGMMAIAHGRVTGQVACCLTIPGPGLLNLATALATATAASVPFLCLAGGLAAAWNGAGLGLLHEIPPILHHEDLLSAWHTLGPSDAVADEVHALLAATSSPPHRPALLEIPVDVGALATPIQPIPTRFDAPRTGAANLAAAGNLLVGSIRPLIVSGGGARTIGSAVLELADKLNAPVVPTVNGRSPALESDRRALPPTALGPLWEACDVVIAAGTRLASVYGSDRYRRSPRPVIRIDADPRRRTTSEAPSVGLAGDAADIVPSLVAHNLGLRMSTWDQHALAELREACTRAYSGVRPQAEYTHALHQALADDAIVALDSTQIAYHTMYALPLTRGRDLLTAGRQGAMGTALAMALGAKLAARHRQVVAVVGDGGLIFGLAELATMAKECLGVTVLVFNDNAYGEVALSSPNPTASTYSQLVNPDFRTLAGSFGIAAQQVSSPGELNEALHHDLARDKPSLIEVPVGPCPSLRNIFDVGAYGGAP